VEKRGKKKLCGQCEQKPERLAKAVFEDEIDKNRTRRAQELLLVKETEQHQQGGKYQSAPAIPKSGENQESGKRKQQANHVGARGNAVTSNECSGE
jgi:hypothetical protein